MFSLEHKSIAAFFRQWLSQKEIISLYISI